MTLPDISTWMYAPCRTGNDRPSVLFERATTWLVTHKVLLPGCTTLERYVSRLQAVRELGIRLPAGRCIPATRVAALARFKRPDNDAPREIITKPWQRDVLRDGDARTYHAVAARLPDFYVMQVWPFRVPNHGYSLIRFSVPLHLIPRLPEDS